MYTYIIPYSLPAPELHKKQKAMASTIICNIPLNLDIYSFIKHSRAVDVPKTISKELGQRDQFFAHMPSVTYRGYILPKKKKKL